MIEWFQGNWVEVLAIATAVAVVAERIAKLTPNKWDDKAVGYVLKVLSLGARK